MQFIFQSPVAADWLDRLHVWLDNQQGLGIWLTAAATTVLAVGVIFAWFAVRDAKRTRHGQLITEIWARYDEPEVRDSRRAYPNHGPQGLTSLVERLWTPERSAEDVLLYEQLSRWPSLIEMIGVLYAEKSLTLTVVERAWGIHIVDAWSVWAEPARRLRALSGSTIVFAYFEALADDLAKKRGLTPSTGARLRVAAEAS